MGMSSRALNPMRFRYGSLSMTASYVPAPSDAVRPRTCVSYTHRSAIACPGEVTPSQSN